jgi:hypothetical protein
VPTDQGAAVVVKGPTRIYWGHKTSVAALPGSEVPIDVRVCLYGAQADGHTLVPHLEALPQDLPQLVAGLRYVLADDAYQGNEAEVARFGLSARLVLPVHPRKAPAGLADQFRGIDHFTPVGFPVCEAGHRFELLGRDEAGGRYIWAAPLTDQGVAVCQGCPRALQCLVKGLRRQIRVDRQYMVTAPPSQRDLRGGRARATDIRIMSISCTRGLQDPGRCDPLRACQAAPSSSCGPDRRRKSSRPFRRQRCSTSRSSKQFSGRRCG